MLRRNNGPTKLFYHILNLFLNQLFAYLKANFVTHPILITAHDLFRPEGQKEPHNNSWEPSNSELTRYPTVLSPHSQIISKFTDKAV